MWRTNVRLFPHLLLLLFFARKKRIGKCTEMANILYYNNRWTFTKTRIYLWFFFAVCAKVSKSARVRATHRSKQRKFIRFQLIAHLRQLHVNRQYLYIFFPIYINYSMIQVIYYYYYLYNGLHIMKMHFAR